MTIDILTGFPETFSGLVNSSILRNALQSEAVNIWVHNLRHFTSDKHGKIDDSPYGGGAGMILMAAPVWSALDRLSAARRGNPLRIYMTPQGVTLTQSKVRKLSQSQWLIILCGHYKDVDARVFERDEWVELSVGDYILSGGEIPAALLVDAIVRLLPGVISDPASAESDSFEDGLLDAPYYTKPEEIEGLRVPAELTSGHHKNIQNWRYAQKLKRTQERRPDLFEKYQQKNNTENKKH